MLVLGLFQALVGLGLWGLSSGIIADPWREGLTFQVAHVSTHPLFLLLVPNLGIEALLQAPQGRLCLPEASLKVHAYFHFSLHGGMGKREGVQGALPTSPEAFCHGGFSLLVGWDLGSPRRHTSGCVCGTSPERFN